MLKARLPGLAAHWLVAAAWLLAIALAATATSVLLTRFTEPERQAAVSRSVSDPQRAAQQIAARAPFAGSATGPSVPLPPARRSEYTLIGVATGFGASPGFALLQGPGGKLESASIGETIGGEATLLAIHSDRIEIERDGVREELPLTAGTASAIATSPSLPNPANLR